MATRATRLLCHPAEDAFAQQCALCLLLLSPHWLAIACSGMAGLLTLLVKPFHFYVFINGHPCDKRTTLMGPQVCSTDGGSGCVHKYISHSHTLTLRALIEPTAPAKLFQSAYLNANPDRPVFGSCKCASFAVRCKKKSNNKEKHEQKERKRELLFTSAAVYFIHFSVVLLRKHLLAFFVSK